MVGGSAHGPADLVAAQVPDAEPNACLNSPSCLPSRQEERGHRFRPFNNTLPESLEMPTDTPRLHLIREALRSVFRVVSVT